MPLRIAIKRQLDDMAADSDAAAAMGYGHPVAAATGRKSRRGA
jgi:hypothetical protein